jgi:beta-phosphoglucomutase family hydrolase
MIEALWDAGAFIFDLDGTLLDNIPAHMRAWATFLASLGHEIDEAQFMLQYSGQSNADILRGVLGPSLSQDETDAYCEQKESLYRDLYRPHMKPVTGLLEFLHRAREAGILMAVATSALPVNVEFTLGGLGLLHWFRAVVTAEDVRQSKPDPEIFLTAASRLGVAPERCIVFEDSLSGLEGARRAEMRAVAITTTLRLDEVPNQPFVLRAAPDYVALLDGSM